MVVGKNQVATNCHVIDKAAKIVVRQALESDIGQSYRMDAAILAQNDERDLCLLFVGELSEPPAAPIVKMGAAKALSIGEEIFAIGAPQGLDLSLSRGIVSQLRRLDDRQTAPYVQTDAAISPGSSGGGLFNDKGFLIGITTFKRVGGENLNFAIPAEWVGDLWEQGRHKLVAQEKARECLDNPDYECVIAAALSIAQSIDDANVRAGALGHIAKVQTKTGNKQEAQDTFAAALSIAQSIKDASYRIGALSAIAKAQAETGNIAAALSIAQSIKDASYRAWALSDIAKAQAETGNIAAALSIARSIDHAYFRAGGLRAIAVAQVKAGNKQEAQDIFAAALSAARSIDDAGSRASVMDAIAETQTREENKQDVQNTSASHSDDIAETQAKEGNFRSAMKTAMRIEENVVRVQALAAIAKHLAAREKN